MAGFQVVSEQEEAEAQVIAHPSANDGAAKIAAEGVMLALRALSQRALVALSTLFTAAGLLSAFWLWSTVLPSPTDRQLIGVSLYGIFLLALEIVRRRR